MWSRRGKFSLLETDRSGEPDAVEPERFLFFSVILGWERIGMASWGN